MSHDPAPILLDDLRTDEMGKKGDVPTNVAEHLRHQQGDVAIGFSEADVIVEREFRTETVHQGYIEPQSSTVLAHEDGRIEIWTSTQGPWQIRDQVSEMLGVPVSMIRVTPMEGSAAASAASSRRIRMPHCSRAKRVTGLSRSRSAHGGAAGDRADVRLLHPREDRGEERRRIPRQKLSWSTRRGAYPGSPVGAAAGVILAPTESIMC